MEPKTFPERLQAVHAELVDIAKTPEMRQIIEIGYYSPDFTIVDAIDAVSELANHYEQSGFFKLQPGQQLDFTPAQNSD